LVQGNADLKNHWVVPRVWTTEVTKTATPDDLIFSVRAPVGEIGRTAFPVVIGRGVASIRGGDYLYAYLEHLGESGYWSSVSVGSTFDAIGGDELRATAIWLPNNGEQCQIGAFFQRLDNLITLHQREPIHFVCRRLYNAFIDSFQTRLVRDLITRSTSLFSSS
jgi:type I restriction enzyme S subunit